MPGPHGCFQGVQVVWGERRFDTVVSDYGMDIDIWLATTSLEQDRHKQDHYKFAHLIDIDKDTAAKSDLRAAKVKVGCDNINAIPKEIHEVIGNQLCKIIIKIENKIVHPKESVLPPHITIVDGVELGFTAGTERPI